MNNSSIIADFSIWKIPKIDMVVSLKGYEYFTFLGDFCGFFLYYTMFIYILLLGFWGYFAFFSTRKKAIKIILVDLATSKRGL